MEKSFFRGTTRYTFQFEPDTSDPNPASTGTFTDEEEVRVRHYYPHIKKGDVVFDIGASFGSYTLPALALGAKVYAFSPEHEYRLIKRNIEINPEYNHPYPLSHPTAKFPIRWYVFPVGMYSKNGYFKTDTTEFSTQDRTKENIPRGNDPTGWAGWWIPVTTLDAFVYNEDLEKIDFIKIDTEGAELEVLKGGLQTIKKYKPKMLVECHIFKDGSMQQKMIDFLEPMGYKLKIVPYGPQISHCFAWI